MLRTVCKGGRWSYSPEGGEPSEKEGSTITSNSHRWHRTVMEVWKRGMAPWQIQDDSSSVIIMKTGKCGRIKNHQSSNHRT